MKLGHQSSFGPDRMALAPRQWTVSWRGRQVHVSTRASFPYRVAVYVDGAEVGRFACPTVKAPWVELLVSDQEPRTKIVMVAYPQRGFRTLLFVAGVSVDDGQPEETWRAAAPAPMDDFEVIIASSRLAGPAGVLVLGCAGALPLVVSFAQTGDARALLFAPLASAIPAGWGAVIVWLVRWLTRRRSWPSQVRIAIVAIMLLAVPVMIILGLQAVASGV